MINFEDGKLSEIDIEYLTQFYSVFSDPTRLKIVLLLLYGEKESYCVSRIAEELGINQPAVSQQLRVLKSAHLVKIERDKRFLRYSISDNHVKELITIGVNHISHTAGEGKNDV